MNTLSICARTIVSAPCELEVSFECMCYVSWRFSVRHSAPVNLVSELAPPFLELHHPKFLYGIRQASRGAPKKEHPVSLFLA